MMKTVRTVATAVVVLALMLGGTVSPASAAVPPPAPQQESWKYTIDTGVPDTNCADVLFVGLRGSGEDMWAYDAFGRMVWDVRDGLKSTLNSSINVRQVAIRYPAPPVEQIGQDVANATNVYLDGMLDGVQRLWTVMMHSVNNCPAERIVVAGYSSGAGAVHRVFSEFPYPDKVSSIILIADPARHSDYRAATHNGLSKRTSGLLHVADLEMAPMTDAYRQKTIEYCKSYDPVCDLGSPNEMIYNTAGIAARIANDKHIHLEYTTASMNSAGRTAAARLNGLFPPDPIVHGSGTPGTDLTANVSNWVKGGPVTYQWYRGGTPIPGATGSTYRTSWADAARNIGVTVTAPGSRYLIKTKASKPTYLITFPAPTMQGTAAVGNTLVGKTGSWDPAPNQYEYVWSCERDGFDYEIQGAKTKTYKVKAADVGCRIRFGWRISWDIGMASSGSDYSATVTS
ncbi:cutinase family protein [Microbacterium sp. P07]|uniref:cutinase family protein n=1 Tax=Microbacterium sp. P07 TaxID=3366952 RepID=UPI003745E6EB